MTQNTVLMRWWIQTVVVIFASILAGHLGWWEALWEADQTKISILICGVYIFATSLAGLICKKNDTKFLKDNENYIWFASEATISLGMIGTVAGFLMLLSGAFVGIDVANTDALQAVISDLAVGMSTALTTTLLGLIASVLLKLQMIIIEGAWEVEDEV